jgi:hypothetical protein
MDFSRYKVCAEYDRKMDTRNIGLNIPYINFPSDWFIRISPPFGGANIRFNIKKFEDSNKNVSVYLDCFSHLACYGEPYWEIYPYEGSVYRCDINDVSSLIEAIAHSLSEIDGE